MNYNVDCSRRLPRRTTRPGLPRRSELIEAVCGAAPGLVVIDEAYAEFARAGHAERARRCCRATRAWWSPGRCPRRSRWPSARVGYLAAAPEVVERCSSCGSRITCPRSPRRWRARAGAAPPSRWPPWQQLRTERDELSRLASAAGPVRGGLRRELRAVRRVRATRRAVWQGCSTGACSIREVGPPRLAAGHGRDAGGDGGVPCRPG